MTSFTRGSLWREPKSVFINGGMKALVAPFIAAKHHVVVSARRETLLDAEAEAEVLVRHHFTEEIGQFLVLHALCLGFRRPTEQNMLISQRFFRMPTRNNLGQGTRLARPDRKRRIGKQEPDKDKILVFTFVSFRSGPAARRIPKV